jgi:hypothetical protein
METLFKDTPGWRGPADVLQQIDQYAEAHGFTRSGFLTQAAKRVMGGAA